MFFWQFGKQWSFENRRKLYDFRIGRKGTVQHDVLTGEYADVFQDGDTINMKVSCREDTSGLSVRESIKYALTVTLEIRENVHSMIYQEVKPSNEPHALLNLTDDQGEIIVVYTPGGGHKFFEELGPLMHSGSPDKRVFAQLFEKYEMTLLGPPLSEDRPKE